MLRAAQNPAMNVRDFKSGHIDAGKDIISGLEECFLLISAHIL